MIPAFFSCSLIQASSAEILFTMTGKFGKVFFSSDSVAMSYSTPENSFFDNSIIVSCSNGNVKFFPNSVFNSEGVHIDVSNLIQETCSEPTSPEKLQAISSRSSFLRANYSNRWHRTFQRILGIGAEYLTLMHAVYEGSYAPENDSILLCSTKKNTERYQIQLLDDETNELKNFKVSKFIQKFIVNDENIQELTETIQVEKPGKFLPFKIETAQGLTATEICNDIWSQFTKFPSVQVHFGDALKLLPIFEEVLEMQINKRQIPPEI
jgi:hypothetical protein